MEVHSARLITGLLKHVELLKHGCHISKHDLSTSLKWESMLFPKRDHEADFYIFDFLKCKQLSAFSTKTSLEYNS